MRQDMQHKSQEHIAEFEQGNNKHKLYIFCHSHIQRNRDFQSFAVLVICISSQCVFFIPSGVSLVNTIVWHQIQYEGTLQNTCMLGVELDIAQNETL